MWNHRACKVDFNHIIQGTIICEDRKKAITVTKIFFIQDVEQQKNYLITVHNLLMPVMHVTQSTTAVSIRRADLILNTRVWEKQIDLTSKPTCHTCRITTHLCGCIYNWKGWRSVNFRWKCVRQYDETWKRQIPCWETSGDIFPKVRDKY